jgi:hypothetical protein
MQILTALILVGILAAIVYFVWYSTPKTDANTLVVDSQPGSTETNLDYALPRSFNQPEGATFSYSMWILIKDFTTGYGTQRRIFSKGDSPGVYIDSTSNSLIVYIDTYGSKESILIPNIPAMKWIHLAIVVNQQAVDIYINGILRQHHTLGQLPNQSEDPAKMGPGWNGVVGRVAYYPKTLSYAEVRKLSEERPPPDMMPKIANPNYFDLTWYIGRLNST